MKTEAKRAAKKRRQARKELRGPVQGLDLVFEDELLRITRVGDMNASQALLVFTGVGARLGKLAPEEFVGSAVRLDTVAYFVTDKAKSWFNAFPPEKLTDVLEPLLRGKNVRSLGNSMGGYGAIWVTRYLNVEVAVAFGAQYSVHSAIVPDETRWMRLRDRITEWRTQSIEDHFVERTNYVTISGSEDSLHWSLFPELTNAKHYIVHGVDHNVPSFLKRTGQLRNVLDSAFDRKYDDLAKSLGPMCYERGHEPPKNASVPAEVERHREVKQKTAEQRESRKALKAEKLRLMTPVELADFKQKTAEQRESRKAIKAEQLRSMTPVELADFKKKRHAKRHPGSSSSLSD